MQNEEDRSQESEKNLVAKRRKKHKHFLDHEEHEERLKNKFIVRRKMAAKIRRMPYGRHEGTKKLDADYADLGFGSHYKSSEYIHTNSKSGTNFTAKQIPKMEAKI